MAAVADAVVALDGALSELLLGLLELLLGCLWVSLS